MILQVLLSAESDQVNIVHPSNSISFSNQNYKKIFQLVFSLNKAFVTFFTFITGAQWLSGRVLDSRPRGRGFEPHQRHWVVVLKQDTFILA